MLWRVVAAAVVAVAGVAGDSQERFAEHGLCAPHTVKSLDLLNLHVTHASYSITTSHCGVRHSP